MKRLVAFLLSVTLIFGIFAPSVAAAKLPFGEELTPLSLEEMEEVDGEYKVAAAVAVLGATSGALQYLAETPQEEWTLKGVALSAASKAVNTFMGFMVGRWTVS